MTHTSKDNPKWENPPKRRWFFRRQMEIKEEQLALERKRTDEVKCIFSLLELMRREILEELKGGLKDGKKNRNTRR